MTYVRNLFLGIFWWSMTRALRASILSSVLMVILASSGGWKYFTSTITAHELARSAAWTHTVNADSLPLVIEIDDVGYQRFFNAKSPVSRERMLALIAIINAHSDPKTRVTIDLDLSPVPGQSAEQTALQNFLFINPQKWILPSVRAGNPQEAASLQQWRTMMCGRGIDFGLPYIPNEFGYPKMTHQYQDSLTDASIRRGTCAVPDGPYVQKPMPLQPMYLKSGLIVPFSGDLVALADILDMVKPKSIVLGGAWGQTDMFATPFGERFGVHIHAAALAGAVSGDALAPLWMELGLSWIFIAFVTTSMYYVSLFMNGKVARGSENMVGHVFFIDRLKPIALIVLAFLQLYLLMEVTSMIHAASGFWISTVKTVGTLVVYLLVPWNLGRAEPMKYRSLRMVMKDDIALPIRLDLNSLRQTARIIFGKSQIWKCPGGDLQMSKGRALFEGSCAFISLLLQTALPLAYLVVILYDSSK